MNKNMHIGILAATLVLSSLSVATGNEQQQTKKQQITTTATEVPAENKAKEKGDYSRVWMKTEITSVDQGAQRIEELQGELAKAESSIQVLRGKLSFAEQGAQGMEELQVKLAKAESSIQELRGRLSSAEQGAQGTEELQVKLAKAESSIQELRGKLSSVEHGAQGTEELQAKLTKAESSIHDLKGKLEESALSIRDLRGKVAAAESAVDQSRFAHEYESVRAQVIGLEKIIEEKNAILEKTGKERDHWKINKDLLLSMITEQQASLLQLQEENRGLLRDLAAKKKELSVVNEQLIQTRGQQQ